MAHSTIPVDELVHQAQGLGLFPEAAREIQRVANDPRTGDRELAHAIEMDPMATARMMKISNAAAFRGTRRISNLREAITRMGYFSARDMAIAMVMGDKIVAQPPLGRQLWEHSVRTGLALACLSRFIKEIPSQAAMTAGLLHDVGLVAMTALHPEFARIVTVHRDGSPAQHAAERMYFGITHAKLGSRMLTAWGLPQDVVTIASVHHNGAPDPLAMAMDLAEAMSDTSGGNPDPKALIQTSNARLLDISFGQLRIACEDFVERAREVDDL